VTPVLREGDQLRTHLGQLIMACASVSEFAAVALLSLLFTQHTTSTSVRLALAAAFVGLIAVVGLVAARTSQARVIRRLFERLHGGTYQIRVRGAIMVMALFVVLAQEVGLEAILARWWRALSSACSTEACGSSRSSAPSSTLSATASCRRFFIWSGISIDLGPLHQPSRIALIGVFFVAFLAVHIVALPLYRRTVSARRLVAGLLGSTSSLPFVVTATTIGQSAGLITAATAAALLVAGVLSALVFPVIALVLVRRDEMLGAAA
jgi:Kef-type K+ transport system membrane component KefB